MKYFTPQSEKVKGVFRAFLTPAERPVGVGTDGAACSNPLDCLQEVRLDALRLAANGADTPDDSDILDCLKTGRFFSFLGLWAGMSLALSEGQPT